MRKRILILLFALSSSLVGCGSKELESKIGNAIKDKVVESVSSELGISEETIDTVIDSIPMEEIKQMVEEVDEEDIKKAAEGISNLLSEDNMKVIKDFMEETSNGLE